MQEQSLQTVFALLTEWYHVYKRDLPWRRTKDPYAIWVSEIMLQQTRVEAVKPYYARFLEELPTIRHLAEADEEQILKLWAWDIIVVCGTCRQRQNRSWQNTTEKCPQTIKPFCG